jgi:hypothetical protein
MGYGGVDLEEPYQAVSGAADDEAAAPPFLGKAPPPAGIHLRLSLCEKVCMTLVVASLFLLAIAAPIWGMYLEKARAPTFTVLLSSLQGIDLARPARVVSPAFNLTLGMNRTCADVRGKVVLCKLRTDGRQPSESPRCSWYSLIYYTTWFS